MKKYIIKDNETQAHETITHIEQYINFIHTDNTTKYANVMRIVNEAHEHTGKYVVPIITSGAYKCDQLFEPEQLVSGDSTWFTLTAQQTIVDDVSDETNMTATSAASGDTL